MWSFFEKYLATECDKYIIFSTLISRTIELPGMHTTREQSPIDIYLNGVDEAKCIVGRIKMVWESSVDSTSFGALVAIPAQIDDKCQKDHVFKISFQLKKEFLDLLTLKPNDEFRLSLRGARLKKCGDIQRSSNIAMELEFSDGLQVQWKRRDGELKTLNTWISMSFLAVSCWSRTWNYQRWWQQLVLVSSEHREAIDTIPNSYETNPRRRRKGRWRQRGQPG